MVTNTEILTIPMVTLKNILSVMHSGTKSKSKRLNVFRKLTEHPNKNHTVSNLLSIFLNVIGE